MRVVEYMGCYAAAPSVVRERWGGQLEETVQPKRDFTVNLWSRVWPQKSAGMETRARALERAYRGGAALKWGAGGNWNVAWRGTQARPKPTGDVQQADAMRRRAGVVWTRRAEADKRALEREGTRVQEGRGPREDFWWEDVGVVQCTVWHAGPVARRPAQSPTRE